MALRRKGKSRPNKSRPDKKTRLENSRLSIASRMLSGKWLRVVPKSVALQNHCKNRNYGEFREREGLRRSTNIILGRQPYEQ